MEFEKIILNGFEWDVVLTELQLRAHDLRVKANNNFRKASHDEDITTEERLSLNMEGKALIKKSQELMDIIPKLQKQREY